MVRLYQIFEELFRCRDSETSAGNKRLRLKILGEELKISFTFLILLLLSNFVSATEYFVSSASEINSAMINAQPGDTLTMTVGTWTNQQIYLNGNGAEGDSILLRAAIPGHVVLNGSSRISINGSYLKVDGLRITGGYNLAGAIDFESGSHHCRVTNTEISEFNPPDPATRYHWINLKGSHNRLDRCFISGMRHSGVSVLITLTGTPYGYHRIDHNFFADKPLGDGNGYETLKVAAGAYSDLEGNIVAEYNYFYRCNGEMEMISNKCHNNIYRYNTFVECRATLTLRQGKNCIVEGNYFFGNGAPETGGIRITHRGHKVFNNYLQDLTGTSQRSAISLYTGMDDSSYIPDDGGHVRVDSVLIAHNTIVNCAVGIYSGVFDSDDKILLPPKDNILANNIVSMNNNAPCYLQDPLYPGYNEFWQGNIFNGPNPGDVPDSGFVLADPELLLTNGWYQISAGSPAVDAAIGDYPFVIEDIDGTARNLSKDAGADELGSGPRQPLKNDDVGPGWLQDPNLPAVLNLRISGSGEVVSDPAGGVYEPGTRVTLTAIPAGDYNFMRWEGDLNSTANPDSILMDANKQVTAVFTLPVMHTLNTWLTGSGRVELDPADGAYSPGTIVTIRAVPDSGWIFQGWSGSLTGSENPDTLLMDDNKLVIVTFVRDPSAITTEYFFPKGFKLYQNYPNPFNPITTISFSLEIAAATRLTIFDALGNIVSEPVHDHLKAGEYKVQFDGSALATGLYFYKLTSGTKQATGRMILMR